MDNTAEAFRGELDKLLSAAEQMGACSIEIRADYLYSRVEGYYCDSGKMIICAAVMKDRMLPGDEILGEPSDGDGRFLEINFQLPRKPEHRTNIEV